MLIDEENYPGPRPEIDVPQYLLKSGVNGYGQQMDDWNDFTSNIKVLKIDCQWIRIESPFGKPTFCRSAGYELLSGYGECIFSDSELNTIEPYVARVRQIRIEIPDKKFIKEFGSDYLMITPTQKNPFEIWSFNSENKPQLRYIFNGNKNSGLPF